MAQYAILIYAHDSAHAPDATAEELETCDEHSDELAANGSMLAAYALTPWLSLSGHAGRFLAASGADHDHDHWDIGAAAKWRRLTLDARYGGTDQPLARCFFTDWCRPGAYASLSYRLLP